MIIDYTPEEAKQLEEIRAEYKKQAKGLTRQESRQIGLRYLMALRDFDFECQKKRFDKLNNDPDLILKDAENQINRVIKYAYEEFIKDNTVEELIRVGLGDYEDDVFKLNGYKIIDPINEQLFYHFKAFKKDKESSNKILKLILTVFEKNPYTLTAPPEPEEPKTELPAYIPVIKGRPTDLFAYLRKDNALINGFAGEAVIEAFNVEFFIENYNEVVSGLSISADKLLNYTKYLFTINNDFRHNKDTINCTISFDLKDYAYRCGKDVFPHDKSDAEKKRASKRLDKFRENVNRDLDLLFKTSVSWKDPSSKNKDKHDYYRVHLFEARHPIKNGIVSFSISPTYAAYLASRNVIGRYPSKLLLMDNRKDTAYRIAKKLFDHYFIDNNIIKGTNDILSLKSLLPYSGLATYEEIQRTDRGHWIERIKEPVEGALDELVQMQILSDWEYTHEKKQPLSDAEAAAIFDYYDYEALYLHFSPFDEIDQHERIEKKQQRIEAARKRKAKRKQDAINQKKGNKGRQRED